MDENDHVDGSAVTEQWSGHGSPRSGGPPRSIGPYELIEEIGRGGMGVVYKARRGDEDRVVAIKLLSGHSIDDPKLRERFLREARAAASIAHPNIAHVHGILDEETRLAIVMDYIAGGTLRSRIRSGQGRDGEVCRGYDVGWVVRIARQIAHGLAAAHNAGVIHRDIKPSNILLDAGGEHAWIADFGLAAFEIGDDSLTSTGRLLGTPAYMSPEQARGERVDRRSDLFSFGCLIYAMVIGESPFHATNYMAMMHKISEYTPVSLADHDPRISIALARVVERLLRKDPAERFDRAEEVIAALELRDDDSGVLLPCPRVDEPAARQAITLLEADVATVPGESVRELERLPATIHDTAGQSEPAVSVSTQSMHRPRKPFQRARILGLGVLAAVVAAASFLLWPHREPIRSPQEKAPPRKPAATPLAPRRRTVATDGTAEYASLRGALEAAQPNDTIEVLDRATYHGPFVFDNPRRLEGVRLVSEAGATLRLEEPGPMAVLSIEGVSRVHVEGFTIVGAKFLHSIMVRGNVPGTTLSRIHIVQPADAEWANVFLLREASGTADDPIRIQNCRFESGKFGLFGGREDKPQALEVSHLLVDGNRFTGTGTHVVLKHSAADVRIEHNLFEGARGIELYVPSPRRSGPFSIVNNTFCGTESWLQLGSDRGDYEVFAVNNLVIDTTGGSWDDAFHSGRPTWRGEHNLWESPGSKGVSKVEGFGRLTDDAGLVSRDATSPDFLRPEAGGLAASAGIGPPEAAYVGSRRP